MLANILKSHPLVLAPMAGTSDRIQRNLCFAYGCDLAYTEMVSAKALIYNNQHSFELLDTTQDDGFTIVQLFGSQAEDLAQGARLAAKAGAQAIDINMGCPVPKVAGQGEGAALLKDSDRAQAIVAAVKDAVSLPVSVKMRVGWEEPLPDLPAFAQGLEAAGADLLAVHGRTRAQYYAGQADWSAIREVVNAVAIPVLANGDVTDLASYEAILEETQAAGVMIGRAALGAPWLFRALQERDPSWQNPPLALRLETFAVHARRLCALSGERVGMQKMRKFFSYYTKGLPHSAAFRRQAYTLESLWDMEKLLAELKQSYGH